MSATLAASAASALSEQGWLELPGVAGLDSRFIVEAVRRAHEAVIPPPIALTEIWIATAVWAVASKSSDRRDIAVISLADVLDPRPSSRQVATGWTQIAGISHALTIVREGRGYDVLVADPNRLTATNVFGMDVTLPTVTLTGPRSEWRSVGSINSTELARLQSLALTMQAAALIGQAIGLFVATIEYVKHRHQFGVPVGSFQALKHRLADLYASLHASALLVNFAASAVGRPFALGLAMATKGHVAQAAVIAGHEAVQLHGGIGFTWEGALHFGLRRCVYLSLSGKAASDCVVEAGRLLLAHPSSEWPTLVNATDLAGALDG
jgi:hypothetical protein